MAARYASTLRISAGSKCRAANVLLPEPEEPINTTRLREGMATLRSVPVAESTLQPPYRVRWNTPCPRRNVWTHIFPGPAARRCYLWQHGRTEDAPSRDARTR